jgi:anti-sigma factor RsiW
MTNCIRPELIAEGDLLAYVEGEASEAIRTHVAACPACAGRAERLRRVNRALMQSLYRVACPPPEMLGQYQLGLLEAADKLKIAAHLRDCPHCTRELAEMEFEAEKTDNLAGMALQLIQKAIKVVEATLVKPGNLAPASVRGEARNERHAYHAAGLDILIGFQGAASQPTGALLGAVVQAETVAGNQAWLFQEGEKPVCSPVDALGTFTFEAVTPGEYDLALESGDTAIVMRGIVLAS